MKILVVNPNISESVTALIQAEAQRAARPDTQLTMATADLGVAYIETPAEALVGGYAALSILAQQYPGHDAAVIAAFGDPGVMEAKEIMPIPVVGLTEAALASAFLLGGRFAIVGISERIGVWYEQTIGRLGMMARYAGYRGLGRAFTNVGNVQNEQRDMLLTLCQQCVREDTVDTIILAGAPLAGLAREISADFPIPLVDGVGCAIRMAEALGGSGYVARTQGAYSPPPQKPHQGMPVALARLIGRADT